MIHIATINGYEIVMPTSGGKAGKGCNKTGTIQVRLSNCIVKRFRFRISTAYGKITAVDKAKNYAKSRG